MGYINWQDENKTVPPRELRFTDLGVAGAAMAEQIIAEVVKERDAAIARAEAAEARVEELENHLGRDVMVVIENQQYRIKRGCWRPHYEPPDTDGISYSTLQEQLAALKAATGWHETGQEVPPVSGLYQVYTGADFNHWYFDLDNEKWEPDIEVESESWPELWRHITELPAPPQE